VESGLVYRDGVPDVYWTVVHSLHPVVDFHGSDSEAAKEAKQILQDVIHSIKKAYVNAYKNRVSSISDLGHMAHVAIHYLVALWTCRCSFQALFKKEGISQMYIFVYLFFTFNREELSNYRRLVHCNATHVCSTKTKEDLHTSKYNAYQIM
jgi:hypothetical protein